MLQLSQQAPSKFKDHLSDRLSDYQHYYNWDRIHGSLGKTSVDREVELGQKTPVWDEEDANYDPAKERICIHEYAKDVRLSKLKPSLRITH